MHLEAENDEDRPAGQRKRVDARVIDERECVRIPARIRLRGQFRAQLGDVLLQKLDQVIGPGVEARASSQVRQETAQSLVAAPLHAEVTEILAGIAWVLLRR